MIRDSLAEDIQLIMIALEIEELELVDILTKSVRRQLKYIFKKDMPKKYWIFYQEPKAYFLSKTLCLEFPSWGSEKYRNMLDELGTVLRKFCTTDISYFDGKTVFLIRGANDEFNFEGAKN